MEWCKIARGEGVMRICAAGLLVATVILVGFDRQTKLLFGFIRKTATYKDVKVLKILIWVDCLAAGYNLIQLTRLYLLNKKSKRCYVTIAWVSFLFDQVAAYGVLGMTLASAEVGVLALRGESGFQWMKVCDRFTHFCIQFGVSLFSGFFAFLLLALISSITSFNLFRLYSPKHLFHLKPLHVN